MEMAVLIAFGLLLLGLMLAALASAPREPAGGGQSPGRRAAPARRRSPEQIPAGRKPALQAERLLREERTNNPDPAPSLIDAWRFQPAPEDFRTLDDEDSAADDMSEIMAQADSIGGRLQARQRILAGVTGSEFHPKQVTELVLSDPALAGLVLHIVNSPYCGLSQKIGSVFRAVVYLGHVEVRNIIWRACVNEGLGSADRAGQALVEGLWQHSFACSKVAFAIAKSRGMAEPDRISTTALLHDIGKLICLNVWPERAKSLYHPVQFSDRSVLEEEIRLGARHARLGAAVAEAWGLPQESLQVIRHHHAPSYLSIGQTDPGSRRALAAVHLADLFVHAATPAPIDTEPAPIYQPQTSWLQLLGVETIEQLCTSEVEAALPRLRLVHLPPMAPEGLAERLEQSRVD